MHGFNWISALVLLAVSCRANDEVITSSQAANTLSTGAAMPPSTEASEGAGQGPTAESPYPTKPHPRGYVAYRAEHTPSINGRLTDPCWEAAPWSEPFLDIEGPAKQPQPWHQTRVKMLWDDQCLYIAAWMDEPQPWATLTLHDAVIYRDNDFEIFIDPDADNHHYFEIEVNALGTVWDLFLSKPYRDGGVVLHSWESLAPSEPTQQDGPTGWKPMRRAVWVDGTLNNGSAGNHSRGWGLEVALPWSLLAQAAIRTPAPPAPGDQWRINFSRVQYKLAWDAAARQYVKDPPDQRENNWVWSPQWQVAMHLPELWGYVQFSQVGSQAAAAGGGGSAPAPDQQFRPDPSWPLRTFLMEGYNMQKALLAREQRYACCLEGLGLAPPPADVAERPLVQSTEAGFIVSAQLPLPPGTAAPGAAGDDGGSGCEGQRRVWRFYVNEDGRISSRVMWVDADPAPPGKGGGGGWGRAVAVAAGVALAVAAAAVAVRRNEGASAWAGRTWRGVVGRGRALAEAGLQRLGRGGGRYEPLEMEEQDQLLGPG